VAADWPTIQQLNYQVFVNDAEHDDDLDLIGLFHHCNSVLSTLALNCGTMFLALVGDQPVG
jgi:hypothetical protein